MSFNHKNRTDSNARCHCIVAHIVFMCYNKVFLHFSFVTAIAPPPCFFTCVATLFFFNLLFTRIHFVVPVNSTKAHKDKNIKIKPEKRSSCSYTNLVSFVKTERSSRDSLKSLSSGKPEKKKKSHLFIVTMCKSSMYDITFHRKCLLFITRLGQITL